MIVLAAIWLAHHAAAAHTIDQPDLPGDPEVHGEPDGVTPPETPAGRQLRSIMDMLNGGRIDRQDLESRMGDQMKKDLAPADLESMLRNVREMTLSRRRAIIERLTDDGEHATGGIIRTDRNRISVFLVVDEKSGRLIWLRFGPADQIFNGGDWSGLDQGLRSLPGQVAFGAYEIVPDDRAIARDPDLAPRPLRIHPIHQFGEQQRLAIGTTASVFILGALAERVASERIAWSDELQIRDDWKSLPSGTMQNVPHGEVHSFEEFALRMMRDNDNTASDHLAHGLGRIALEDYFRKFSGDPARTIPFLTTAEAFKLKLGTPDRSHEYIELDDDAQRRFLHEDGGQLSEVRVATASLRAWSDPVLIDTVQWFATPEECASVMLDLRRLEQHPRNEPMRELMRRNPGLKLDRSIWKQIAYKGGAEPGVLNMTWLLQREDDRWYILTIGWNNPERPLEERPFIALARRGINLLEKHNRAPRTHSPSEDDGDVNRDIADSP